MSKVIEQSFIEELKECYLDYSMSVIVGRALPDVRDGLKPVHRRILFAMHELNNYHNQPYKKSARVVGDIIGKFHPHGDGAAYGALVRLAQPFSMGHTLVEGQGNFGSIDSDPPAAMRYTEVRLEKLTNNLLDDLEKETVDFSPNYDDSLKEPTVLPARFPNLLINGSEGIAVGMATSIAPHNLCEVIDATIRLIKNKDTSDKKLYEIIKAPDFPTCGTITNTENDLFNIMKSGRGSITIQSKIVSEKNKTGRDCLIVTEIPYQSNKAKIVEKISECVKEKKIKFINEIRDESDKSGVRIVIELKYSTDKNEAISSLFRLTPLQSTFSVNNLAIVKGVPKTLSVREIIENFIEFRKDVVIKRTNFDLKKNQERAHIVEGLIIASNDIDAIIKIIRECSDEDGPKKKLMKEFDLSERQTQSILDMKLAKLSKFEYKKLKVDFESLQEEISKLKNIIDNNEERDSVIIGELKEIAKQFGRERLTKLTYDGV